ncbi:MAG: DUF4446 family protein [Candidatus Pacebacteria bacterium]|nr:DUF4446 family protein [Candidatus Paceibacterota bacterium]
MIFTNEIIIYTLLGINTLLILWIINIELRIRKVKILKDAQVVIEKFKEIEGHFNDYWDFKKETQDNLISIEDKLKLTIQNIEIVRFNPFKNDGMGGDQSFAFTLLNKKGTGVIVSSLYSREKVSVFTKPVIEWKSTYKLSEEETDVLNKTQKSLS